RAGERAFETVWGKARRREGEVSDLIYARLHHPNAEILENHLAPLEREANAAAVFHSGMAAVFTVMMTSLDKGGSLIYTQPLYGGTHLLIHQVLEPLGFGTRPLRAGD